MNWYINLMHKHFDVEYVMYTNIIGDLKIKRAKKIADNWYINHMGSRYELLHNGSLKGWSPGICWTPITNGVPYNGA